MLLFGVAPTACPEAFGMSAFAKTDYRPRFIARVDAITADIITAARQRWCSYLQTGAKHLIRHFVTIASDNSSPAEATIPRPTRIIPAKPELSASHFGKRCLLRNRFEQFAITLYSHECTES